MCNALITLIYDESFSKELYICTFYSFTLLNNMPVPGTPLQEFSWHVVDTKYLSNLLSLSLSLISSLWEPDQNLSNCVWRASSPHPPPPPYKIKFSQKPNNQKTNQKQRTRIFPILINTTRLHKPTNPPKKKSPVSKLRPLYDWSMLRLLRLLNGWLDEDDSTSSTTPGESWSHKKSPKNLDILRWTKL